MIRFSMKLAFIMATFVSFIGYPHKDYKQTWEYLFRFALIKNNKLCRQIALENKK